MSIRRKEEMVWEGVSSGVLEGKSEYVSTAASKSESGGGGKELLNGLSHLLLLSQ